MTSATFAAALQKCFASTLDTDEVDEIIGGFNDFDLKVQSTSLDMGLILSDYSIKAAATYFRIVPEVLRFISLDELGGWVGMGIKIAQKSAGAGIRFFKEGRTVFSQLPSRSHRDRFIQQGLSLAEQDINLASEYYRQVPLLLLNHPMTEVVFSEWLAQGVALGEDDYTLAIEYFRISPTLCPHLPMSLIPKWITVGKKLATGKLLPTLLFMRNSPEVFSNIPSDEEKERLLDLSAEIAEQDKVIASRMFTQSVSILPSFQALTLQGVLLDKSLEIARFDGRLAGTLFLNGPKILEEMSGIEAQFPTWVDRGIDLLKERSESAESFFSLKSKSSQTAIDQLRGGISLSTISRTLKLFAAALSGQKVTIQPTAVRQKGLAQELSKDELDLPTTDGETIYLPAHCGRFATDDLNLEWYKVATAYQTGYLEFGTFYPKISETADLIETLQNKYKRRGGFSSLNSFFMLFPDHAFVKQLFEISEGARIEFQLRKEYPGLRKALIRMREADLEQRPSLIGKTPRGSVLELLLQISLAGKTKEPIPTPLQPILFKACQIMGVVQDTAATVATSMKVAANTYDLLNEGEDFPEPTEGPMEAFEEKGTEVRGKSEESGTARPSTRGTIDPKRVEEATKIKQEYTDQLLERLKEAGVDLSSEAVADALSKSVEGTKISLGAFEKDEAEDHLDRLAEALAGQKGGGGKGGKRAFYYDEWNCVEADYRPAWCRVVEKKGVAVENSTLDEILDEYHGTIKSITASFQYLRPEGLKKIKGVREGDELDLDRLLSSRVEIKAGWTPSDRIYITRLKKERSVAVAFLIDVSGSTQQQLPDQNKSILQVEKESLILLSKAVDIIGDHFALYGFSGKGKDTVDFQILKDFEEPYGRTIDQRIVQILPAIQNRDGAAIRHSTMKLSAQGEKIKILVLISDGKPLDDDYRGSYATADTRMALQEARRQGIRPYCITVDSKGSEYLRGMYGDVAYMVIDQVATLPHKLPQIYKRLTV